MLNVAYRLPVGSVAFVVESETLYVRVQSGFRPATVRHGSLCSPHSMSALYTVNHVLGIHPLDLSSPGHLPAYQHLYYKLTNSIPKFALNEPPPPNVRNFPSIFRRPFLVVTLNMTTF